MQRITKAMKIEALQAARRIFAKRRANYYVGICFCLPSTIAGSAMRVYIHKELGDHEYLGGWLRMHRPELGVTIGDTRLKEYRLQWIDWMIACLEGKNP